MLTCTVYGIVVSKLEDRLAWFSADWIGKSLVYEGCISKYAGFYAKLVIVAAIGPYFVCELQKMPPRPAYTRAVSYLSGYLIRVLEKGCRFYYITHNDPRGTDLPEGLDVWQKPSCTEKSSRKCSSRIWWTVDVWSKAS